MQPIALDANLPATFYRGSGRLASFRSVDLPPRPEDWIASATARFGQEPNGLSRLPDGQLLRDAIAADPLGWLGPEHVARHGADPALLVKLLDAGQRLPVHLHPSRAFARAHLACPHGKTEAWIVLDAAPHATVRLGFRRDIDVDELTGWVREQDVSALLSATNSVPVSAGDVLLCPAGLPHAIGSDVLLVELQEPTDFSILLEWDGFPLGPQDAFLGLPLDLALECVDRRRCPPDRLDALRGSTERLLPAEADPFFLAERVGDGSQVPGYAVLIGTAGAGRLAGGWGSVPFARGTTVVLPFAGGACTVTGEVAGICCRPPIGS
jgi:mannose-6-phosphate isomerase